MAAAAPASVLKGTLTVKVTRCRDLEKGRMLGKMDPYVKIHLGGEEKFKTKTCKDGDRAPVFDQAFLFNLSGKETDVHIKVFDNELLGDSVIGRADISILTLLQSSGTEKEYDLVDVDNFRKNTGKISLIVTFSGTGGPSSPIDAAPINGLFHFQHNSTGFLVHVNGEQLELRGGGLNDRGLSFEFIGTYVRYVPTSAYLTGRADGSLFLQGAISEESKWKWTGVTLQHASTGKYVHPLNDALASGTVLCLAPGTSGASGFSLVASTASASPPVQVYSPPSSQQPVSPAQVSVSPNPPATNPNAVYPNLAAQQQHQQQEGQQHHQKNTWHCTFCTFENPGHKTVCEMCSKTRATAAPGGASPSSSHAWELHNVGTYPASATTTVHPHPLFQLPTVYRGTYNCDICSQPGQGIVYHCEPCSFDAHPHCTKNKLRS